MRFMIYGAVQILHRIPAKFLDPWLVVASQAPETSGFVLISYPPDDPPGTPNTSIRSRFFDLLFFEGRTLLDCARLHRDFRRAITARDAADTFRRDRASAEISLFASPREILLRFQS